jgi:NAD(P)-dependent dehydrogenase (short-subunit alcohol dehydrogenase family)
MGTRLSNKIAVVTGGGGGIGAEICSSFAGEGASVAVADIDIEAARKVAAEINGAGSRAVAIAFDVTDVGATGEAPIMRLTATASSGLSALPNPWPLSLPPPESG